MEDFDPSEFLAMAMTEEQSAIYTAPEIPESSMMTVEGGLQMEQDLHIPIPMFGALDDMSDGTVEPHCDLEETMEPEEPITPLPVSSVDGTSSPHPTTKIITSCEETYFRRYFYDGNYERVKLFRLHCTICDRHLGCAPWLTERQMRKHKLLSVSVCRKCFEFYGDINFPLDDESEIYCCWCGEGGEVFCCSACPKTVCKRCIKRNFGDDKIKEIDENDTWKCYLCDPTDIYPHRALFWGLHRFSKHMRQQVANLSKEDKIKLLSKDSSHCCSNGMVQFQPIQLPHKSVMSKVPIQLIAGPHRLVLKNQLDFKCANTATSPPVTNVAQTRRSDSLNRNLLPTVSRSVTITPTQMLQNHLQTTKIPPKGGPSRKMLDRGSINRTTPYPTKRQSLVQAATRALTVTEVIDLVDNSPDKQHEMPQSNHNIGWLEKGVNDVNHTLISVKLLVDQFNTCKNDLNTDFETLITFSDKLSDRIKITICSLAKINQEMVDAKKSAVDDQTNSVMLSNLKASVSSVNVTVNNKPKSVAEQSPVNTIQTDEEEGLTAALLCETVLEGTGGNKENEHGNKHTSKASKKTAYKARPRSLQKGKSLPVNTMNRFVNQQQLREDITVINLIDDDDFDSSYYCKKYKVTPCKVVLTRCNQV